MLAEQKISIAPPCFTPEASSSRFARLIRRANEFEAQERPSSEAKRVFYTTFLKWLALKIQEQCADVEELLDTLPAEQHRDFLEWLRDGRYATLIPAWAMDFERDLFLGDFQIVVELIAN